GRGLAGVRAAGLFPIFFALAFPIVGATLGITTSKLLGFSQGDALLFAVLCASASYIAVPAVMKTAVPEANPGLYLPMALGLTFPLNIILGIPLYYAVIQRLIAPNVPNL
ncbi:MAG TPA: sodium-dependent bicarbonate transport family permease, partial [Chthoniobacterales bacterium]|nr:sodium-dependent bicarbonate transport family permease [Chthoniobacterales bacterium]